MRAVNANVHGWKVYLAQRRERITQLEDWVCSQPVGRPQVDEAEVVDVLAADFGQGVEEVYVAATVAVLGALDGEFGFPIEELDAFGPALLVSSEDAAVGGDGDELAAAKGGDDVTGLVADAFAPGWGAC